MVNTIFIIVVFIAIFIVLYRTNSNSGNVYRFINRNINVIYEKYAPYSFRVIREKVKELGQEYTPKQYAIQIFAFASGAAIVTYLYFFNIIISIIYAVIAVTVIPYLTYLRCKRL